MQRVHSGQVTPRLYGFDMNRSCSPHNGTNVQKLAKIPDLFPLKKGLYSGEYVSFVFTRSERVLRLLGWLNVQNASILDTLSEK